MQRQNDKPLVRVTNIEAYRRYAYQSEYANYEITEESVIEGITKAFEGNEFTRIGTAFHSIVETGKPKCEKVSAGVREFTYYGKPVQEAVPEGRRFDIDGFPVTLDVAQCKVAMEYRNEHPQAFHEFRMYKDYGRAVVTGCADMIDGVEIRDIKTKYSLYFSDEDYINSCQWRYYLEMFDADVFHFDLFCFDGYNKDKHGYDVRGLPLTRRWSTITCYRYEGMEADNLRLLDEFLNWAEARNLLPYLVNQKVE